jgi:hypothetical protein
MKYEFTEETLKVGEHTLHRVRYLADGELGGWIESENNLSQDDNALVFGNAWVFGHAKVFGNMYIFQ